MLASFEVLVKEYQLTIMILSGIFSRDILVIRIYRFLSRSGAEGERLSLPKLDTEMFKMVINCSI